MKQAPLLGDVDPAARRAFDFYPTPQYMVRALMKRVSLFDVFEPCAGAGDIANVLQASGCRVVTNDLDLSRSVDFNLDMTLEASWQAVTYPFVRNRLMWGVTNLPFDVADAIVPLAVAHLPHFATILRLSWLEPTAARARFLSEHPPAKLIVMPRHDFKGRGSTDSVTSAWFCWEQGISFRHPPIDVVTRDERDELIAKYGRATS